jgi:hypothetical protein
MLSDKRNACPTSHSGGHNNPMTGKWQLAINAIEYLRSSARFYLTGMQGIYPVTNFMEMEEVVFNKSEE